MSSCKEENQVSASHHDAKGSKTNGRTQEGKEANYLPRSGSRSVPEHLHLQTWQGLQLWVPVPASRPTEPQSQTQWIHILHTDQLIPAVPGEEGLMLPLLLLEFGFETLDPNMTSGRERKLEVLHPSPLFLPWRSVAALVHMSYMHWWPLH